MDAVQHSDTTFHIHLKTFHILYHLNERILRCVEQQLRKVIVHELGLDL